MQMMRESWIATVLLIAAGTIMLASMRGRVAHYRPAASAPRLGAADITTAPIGRVFDVALSGDHLYVLDGASSQVVVLRTGTGGVVRTIGRAGGGPGELLAPHGIAVSVRGDSIAVTDRGVLHLFDTDGTYLRSTRPRYPCAANDARVAWTEDGIHLYASCMRPRSDTLHAVVWRMSPGGELMEVAQTGRYTFDGSWGSVFGARFTATEAAGVLALGTGATPCIQLLSVGSGVEQRCAAYEQPFSAAPPPEFDRRTIGATALGRWPDPLPWFIDRTRMDADLLLVRPFRYDSVVVRRIVRGTSGLDELVAPLDSFVRCRVRQCFWAEHDTAETRLWIVTFGPTPAAPSPSPHPAVDR